MYRTKNLGELRIENVGEEVELSGWVQKIRNLGGMIFIDLRDEDGITQVVVNDEELQIQAKELVKESCIHINGKVVERSSKNPNMPTGDIEVVVNKIEVLGKCKPELPFEINSEIETKEDLRLEYRFLDLRNEKLHNSILFRAKVLKYLRDKMEELGFPEIQTPILANSSPEGARDYLVPSRINPGEFYALPQAPQQFKQLLMVSGFNKYFQIAPCFRDEDPRADRTLEFYQLDLEMSFVEEDDVLNVGEEIFYDTFTKFSNKKVSPRPFRRIQYNDAIDLYGSDKPDLRFGMEIQDITKIFSNTEFTVFKNLISEGGMINAIVAKDAADKYSRKQLDELTEFVKSKKASGLAYLKIADEVTGSIAKVVTEAEVKELTKQLKLEKNDLVLIVSGPRKIVKPALGALRLRIGDDLGLMDPNRLELCIINDFPMFEWDEQNEKWDFCHNPFSLPHGGIQAYDNTTNLENILAYQFDFVCNGNEMASGAIRNHDLDSLAKGFEIVGYSREEVEQRFKSIFTAFKYGCPPHGGMAPGLDRIIMLIQDEPNLREVQAFPPSASGQDLMMGSPSELTKQQLEELKIQFKKEKK